MPQNLAPRHADHLPVLAVVSALHCRMKTVRSLCPEKRKSTQNTNTESNKNKALFLCWQCLKCHGIAYYIIRLGWHCLLFMP